MFRNICLAGQLKTGVELITKKVRIMVIFSGGGWGGYVGYLARDKRLLLGFWLYSASAPQSWFGV